jgi:hypothetical protein
VRGNLTIIHAFIYFDPVAVQLDIEVRPVGRNAAARERIAELQRKLVRLFALAIIHWQALLKPLPASTPTYSSEERRNPTPTAASAISRMPLFATRHFPS